jgi:hypothetical protein
LLIALQNRLGRVFLVDNSPGAGQHRLVVQRGIAHARQHQYLRLGTRDECRYRVDAVVFPEIEVEDNHIGGGSRRNGIASVQFAAA